jgi:hypothetical protein
MGSRCPSQGRAQEVVTGVLVSLRGSPHRFHNTVVLEVVSGNRAKMNHLRDAPQNLYRPYFPFLGMFLHREGRMGLHPL